jgi:putative ABC transport system substrate-binding protein
LKRREFIGLLGSAAVTWSLAARAQQANRVRRNGVLIPFAPNDPGVTSRILMIQQGLQKLGWTDGGNLRIDFRWSDDAGRMQTYAAELVAMAPNVILCAGTPALSAMQRETHTIPIVFVLVTDPVRTGLVSSLAHPGGNITGVALVELSIAGKWIELLKEAAPHIARVLVIQSPENVASSQYIRVIEALAGPLGLNVTVVPVHDTNDVQRAMDEFAQASNGGLLVVGSPKTVALRASIVAGAAQHRLPAIYPYRLFVTAGGLMSYGTNETDQYGQALPYVDRILRGERPGDLPVQLPTRFKLVANLKAAKAIGLAIPESFLVRADELIE